MDDVRKNGKRELGRVRGEIGGRRSVEIGIVDVQAKGREDPMWWIDRERLLIETCY